MTASATPRPVYLPPAERKALDELCRDGASNGTIAQRIGVSTDTIRSQLCSARRAVGVATSTELIAAVLQGRVTITENRVATVTHLGPRPGAQLLATGCCHRLVDDLPSLDVVTRSPDKVTCGGRT